MKDKRRSPRSTTRLAASFAGFGLSGIREGALANLSVGGAAVTSLTAVETGKEVALYIHEPGDPTPIIIDLGIVRWAADRGFGVEFVVISRRKEKERLRRLLARLASGGNPA